VATAAAAQALFTVSGLDQQLRRFVPQTGIFEDFTVRLTSAYSKTSMTVEPRWEFETKALDSRLRIRYQAPLSNSNRGQKAQVEYRLGDRASVQLQWDNDNIDVSGGDLGADFKLRWEWSD
jgi:translocation and assembly module TamB